jgi:hypothetical protein
MDWTIFLAVRRPAMRPRPCAEVSAGSGRAWRGWVPSVLCLAGALAWGWISDAGPEGIREAGLALLGAGVAYLLLPSRGGTEGSLQRPWRWLLQA